MGSTGFLPSDFYDLNSYYGSEAQLRELIASIHSNGMRACADVVINRLAGAQPEGHVAWKPVGGTVDEVGRRSTREGRKEAFLEHIGPFFAGN